MTNTAIRRAAGALVAGFFIAVSCAVSIAPAHADPAYDQKFLDYIDAKGVPFSNRTQIIGAANEAKRDVVKVIHTIPAPKGVYSPHFYWLSPSALSRRILWFTLGQSR